MACRTAQADPRRTPRWPSGGFGSSFPPSPVSRFGRAGLIRAIAPWAVSTMLLMLAPLLGQDMIGEGEPRVTGAAVAMLLAAIVGGQILLSWAMRRGRPAVLAGLLVAQVILTFLPPLLGQQIWVVMPGLLVASVLIALRGVNALGACGLVLAGQILLQTVSGQHAPRAPLTTATILAIGIGLRLLIWLACGVVELSRDQLILADVAVRAERMRFSRDLHDTLVHDLAAIGLRGEIALKLVPAEAHQARAEIQHITDLARGAMTDARSVVRGYRRLSLQAEIDNALGTLTAAGISCEAQVAEIPDNQAAAEVFACAIREGATNILRHSRARSCVVRTASGDGQISLELINDGGSRIVTGSSAEIAASAPGGSGLAGLAERAEALGGRLTCGVSGMDGFRVRVDLPAHRHWESGRGCTDEAPRG